jgi:putative ABC transport system ATP-binding protein
VLVATHDDRMIALADRVVEMTQRLDVSDAGPSELTFRRGEVVFEQGSRGSLVYVVASGRVELVRRHADGSDELLGVVGAGEYFGELGPMLGLPRSATARAAAKTVLVAYSERDFRHRAGAGERERLRVGG